MTSFFVGRTFLSDSEVIALHTPRTDRNVRPTSIHPASELDTYTAAVSDLQECQAF